MTGDQWYVVALMFGAVLFAAAALTYERHVMRILDAETDTQDAAPGMLTSVENYCRRMDEIALGVRYPAPDPGLDDDAILSRLLQERPEIGEAMLRSAPADESRIAEWLSGEQRTSRPNSVAPATATAWSARYDRPRP